jgi:nucleoside-diphosphate-sugar epimerase
MGAEPLRFEPLRIVLLGASGFVGSAVLRQLERAAAAGVPCEAQLLVHRAQPASLPAFARVHRGALGGGDDAWPARLLPREPHVVVHCASKQVDADGSGFGVNLLGVEQLCRAVAASGGATRAVLFVSSFSVYGEGPQRGVDEAAPQRPETPLARSRAACEERLAQLAAHGQCAVTVLRTRFVLGAGDRHVLPGLLKLARSRIRLGSEAQRYSVIDVDELARVLLRLAQDALQGHAHGATPAAPFEVFNAACAQPIALRDIRAALAEAAPTRSAWWRLPVSPWWWRAVARGGPRLARLAHRVLLMGQDRFGSVARLQTRLGPDWLQTDPRDVVRRAARDLRPHRI